MHFRGRCFPLKKVRPLARADRREPSGAAAGGRHSGRRTAKLYQNFTFPLPFFSLASGQVSQSDCHTASCFTRLRARYDPEQRATQLRPTRAAAPRVRRTSAQMRERLRPRNRGMRLFVTFCDFLNRFETRFGTRAEGLIRPTKRSAESGKRKSILETSVVSNQ